MARVYKQTVEEIAELLRNVDAKQFAVLERSLAADSRKTVAVALEAARKRLAAQEHETARVHALYENENAYCGGVLCAGIDEVGRGPLAGPLTVAAVVLPRSPEIAYLNDSKQVAEARRDSISDDIKAVALAYAIVHVQPSDIDAQGMSQCLKHAFAEAIKRVDDACEGIGVVLIDGNPVRIDEREVNVVKGDATCASISAASILAKTERDAIMRELDERYPGYGFAENKGYASPAHQEALKSLGLCPVHRKSFCASLLQPTLF